MNSEFDEEIPAMLKNSDPAGKSSTPSETKIVSF